MEVRQVLGGSRFGFDYVCDAIQSDTEHAWYTGVKGFFLIRLLLRIVFCFLFLFRQAWDLQPFGRR